MDLYQINVLEGVIDYAANLLQGDGAKNPDGVMGTKLEKMNLWYKGGSAGPFSRIIY